MDEFKILMREAELMIEERNRIESYLKYIQLQIRLNEEKLRHESMNIEKLSAEFASRHFRFRNKRVEEWRQDLENLIEQLAEINHNLSSYEEKLWKIVEKRQEIIPAVLFVKTMAYF